MTDEAQARIDKVQKLLNKAEGASTEEEAHAFFAKAEELMTRWAIDDAMLQAAGKQKAEEIVVKRITLKTSYFIADIRLADEVARSNGCQVLQSKQDKRITFIGFESDVERVITLFMSLHMQAARFANQAFRHEVYDDLQALMRPMDKHIWKRSFRLGFASRVGQRLRERVQETKVEAAKVHGSGMELVLVDRSKQVAQRTSELTSGKARGGNFSYDGHGAAAGRRAADRADVGNSRISGRRAIR